MRRQATSRVACSVVMLCAQQALADGQFLQADISSSDSVIVGMVSRGSVAYGVTRSSGDERTSVVSVLGTRQVGSQSDPVTLRLGPAIKFDESGSHAGARGTIEQYIDLEASGVFLLAEYFTVDKTALLLASWQDYATGMGFELSVYREDDDAPSPSIGLTSKIFDTGFTLRTGYKPHDDQWFVGLSYISF